MCSLKTVFWTATTLAVLFVVSAAQTKPETPPRALLTFAVQTGRWDAGLCTARPDGSALMRLTGYRQPDRAPAWSRDGKALAFSRAAPDSTWKIVVADARGRLIRSLHHKKHPWVSPAWSPDGKRIAVFESYGADGPLRVIDSRSGKALSTIGDALREASHTNSPSWSPDGLRIFFEQQRPNERPNVYSARPDGSEQRLLVRDAFHPQLSSDGTKLAYFRSSADFRVSALVVSNADGSNEHVLVDEMSTFDTSLAWSPDGTRLAVERSNAKSGWIVVVQADTGLQVGIIKRRGWFFRSPAWRAPVARPNPGKGACY